jgi:hypothetical protein
MYLKKEFECEGHSTISMPSWYQKLARSTICTGTGDKNNIRYVGTITAASPCNTNNTAKVLSLAHQWQM